MRVRARFDEKLEEMENQLIKMGAEVEEIVTLAFKSFSRQDHELAKKVIKLDDSIDELEIEIEKRCINLIALQQPLAADLREVAGILKIITDLERIGDYAVNIAKITLEFEVDEALIKPLIDLPKMEALIKDMIKGGLDSFVSKDVNQAREVALLDDKVDNLYKVIYSDLLEYGVKDQQTKQQIIRLLFVGRHLERIGDHVTNICERVIYMLEGVRENY